ncbi:MAG TPA: malto-oligosyltrehalose trehalohydrolase [Lacipirellulaceae bacterium]
MAIAEFLQNALPMGADVSAAGTRFRVWAPERKSVELVLVDSKGKELARHRLGAESNGFFSSTIQNAQHGSLYFFQLDDDPKRYPDPASRFQPQGVHGPSQVIDPSRFAWRDREWPGVRLAGPVIYELHIGTFTPEDTWKAAIEKLPHLRDVGVSLVEVMPVAAFPGKFGWGYDGVSWFAPTQLYGEPDDFRAFVDEAHQLKIGVILDVVYNHFGPAGNYAPTFSEYFLSKKHHTEWGDAINFDGDECGPVREFIAANAAFWIREFHLDGLRLDAVHSIIDDSPEHIVSLLTRAARAAAGKRSIVIFGENERQQTQYVLPPEDGGYGIDGLWNDDFHHACRVAATGNAEAYYRDYRGSPQELVSAIRLNYLYQGQWNARQAKYRGTPAHDIAAPHFVHFLQNHDQVANSARGLRTHLLTSPGRHRALSALLLLGPQTPLLFMGQEFGASSPFFYFADHEPELAALVRQGRHEFMGQFPRVTGFDSSSPLPDPADSKTFAACRLDWSELARNVELLDLHRDLIALRREDVIFSRQDQRAIEGAVAGPEAFILRWFDEAGNDRLGLFNLGRDVDFSPPSEPLIAPPPDRNWTVLWSSEDPRYGGMGTPAFDEKAWRIPGPAAVIFRAEPA